jgi:hypothetical protein
MASLEQRSRADAERNQKRSMREDRRDGLEEMRIQLEIERENRRVRIEEQRLELDMATQRGSLERARMKDRSKFMLGLVRQKLSAEEISELVAIYDRSEAGKSEQTNHEATE